MTAGTSLMHHLGPLAEAARPATHSARTRFHMPPLPFETSAMELAGA